MNQIKAAQFSKKNSKQRIEFSKYKVLFTCLNKQICIAAVYWFSVYTLNQETIGCTEKETQQLFSMYVETKLYLV